MHRDLAYHHLLKRMGEVRSLGYASMRDFVGETLISEPVYVADGLVWIDVGIKWQDRRRGELLIWGIASGTNWQNLERIDEHLVVRPENTGSVSPLG